MHHVVYNVADIVPFLDALDAKARRRVVLELPPHHPLSWMNPLWKQFHGVDRPMAPIAGDLVEILGAMGVADLRAEYWTNIDPAAADGSDSETLEERAKLVTQRLCLPVERESEVATALADVDPGYHRDLVTISWTHRDQHLEAASTADVPYVDDAAMGVDDSLNDRQPEAGSAVGIWCAGLVTSIARFENPCELSAQGCRHRHRSR